MKKQTKQALIAVAVFTGLLFLAPLLFVWLLTADFSHYPTVAVTYTDAFGETQSVGCSLVETCEDGTYVVRKDPRFPPWIHVLNDAFVIEHIDGIFEEYLCGISVMGETGGADLYSEEPGFFVKYAVSRGKGLLYRLLSVGPADRPCLYRLEKNGEPWYYVDYDRWAYFDFATRQTAFFPSEEDALRYCSQRRIPLGRWYDRSDRLAEYTAVPAG